MGNLEQAVERRQKETERLIPQPVPRMKEVPTRVVVEVTHPPKDVAQRLRENLTPPEKTDIGRNVSVRLCQDSEIAGNADEIRFTNTAENLRKAIEKLLS